MLGQELGTPPCKWGPWAKARTSGGRKRRVSRGSEMRVSAGFLQKESVPGPGM